MLPHWRRFDKYRGHDTQASRTPAAQSGFTELTPWTVTGRSRWHAFLGPFWMRGDSSRQVDCHFEFFIGLAGGGNDDPLLPSSTRPCVSYRRSPMRISMWR
jgi:hypothetical protein